MRRNLNAPSFRAAGIICVVAAGLLLDQKLPFGGQIITNIAVWLIFICILRHASRQEQVSLVACVFYATIGEIFLSLAWGLYEYRLGNIPLFVPPGHGAVYLFGLLAARTPVVLRYGRRVAHVILAGASTWALAGLTVLPLVTGRFDLQGAICLPVFAWFVLRSPRWPLFAAIFIATGELEIFGTVLGNWQWLPIAPWTHIPSGNPPSVIAGGYCVIDASVVLAMRGVLAIRTQVRRGAGPYPSPPAGSTATP